MERGARYGMTEAYSYRNQGAKGDEGLLHKVGIYFIAINNTAMADYFANI